MWDVPGSAGQARRASAFRGKKSCQREETKLKQPMAPYWLKAHQEVGLGLNSSLERANPQHTEESTEPSQNKKSKAAASYGRLLICLPSPETRTMSRIKNTIFQRQGARQQPHTQKCQDQENGRKETCPEHTRLLPNFERPLRLSSRGRSGPTGEERGDASQGKGQTPRSQESRKKRHVQKHKHTPPNFERLFAPRWLRLPTHIKKIRFLWLKPISFLGIFCFKFKKL